MSGPAGKRPQSQVGRVRRGDVQGDPSGALCTLAIAEALVERVVGPLGNAGGPIRARQVFG
jgi:hypothetical protein